MHIRQVAESAREERLTREIPTRRPHQQAEGDKARWTEGSAERNVGLLKDRLVVVQKHFVEANVAKSNAGIVHMALLGCDVILTGIGPGKGALVLFKAPVMHNFEPEEVLCDQGMLPSTRARLR